MRRAYRTALVVAALVAPSVVGWGLVGWGLAGWALIGSALAQTPGAGGGSGAGGGPTAADTIESSCVEYVPEGATRPKIETKLPSRSLTGYAVELVVTITHGPGETVMPEGFKIQRGSDAMIALNDADWVIPEPDGGSAPLIDRPDVAPDATSATTTVAIPFVPLPDDAGRHRMTLPSLPISVARANGQVMTLCTDPMRITIDDPIANEVDPQVKPNPPPRPQREPWEAAKQATYITLAVIALSLVLAYLINRYRRRPKPAPPKPRVLPWIAAMRELDELRGSRLLEEENFEEFFDRVDNATRHYLGERYGFDGLESTSSEIRELLGRVYPPIKKMELIDRFLTDTDFVKYAEVEPSRQDCEDALARATEIITATIPPTATRPERQERKAA